MKTTIAPAVFLSAVLLAACSAEEGQTATEAAAASSAPFYAAAAAWPALALLETGEHPLWFELGPHGPVHIQSPHAATLAAYMPWPHARFVAEIMPWEGFLVMAVNQDGFFILRAETSMQSARAMLYRVADGGFWAPYTIGSFFLWRDQPAALLYRNDFFTAIYPVSPQPQVFVLDKSSPVPLGAEVPALHDVFPGESWEAETLRRGPSGYWYFRMREKGSPRNRSAFFRARDLEGEGERISQAAWRSADLPQRPEQIPPNLSVMLDEAVQPGQAFALRALSAGFEGARFFRSAGEQVARLYAFCREDMALLLRPDGQGLYAFGTAVRPFSLPALPEGFAYTGIAVLGEIVLATWEEQQGAAIGAAGFMVRNAFW